jgi:ribonuclease R
MLKLSVLKSMKRAAYHPDCTGHYGLAMDNYTHFTSPIRRYSDLLVHRIQANLLFGERAKLPSYGEMKEISEHLSDTERNAAEAELESRKLKELAYFQKLITEGTPTAFDAVVTDLRRVGLFVELSEVMTKGIVRKEGLPDRGAYFDATRNRFHCPKSGHTFKQGDVIRVIPVEVEKGRGTVAFQFVSGGSNEKAIPSREAARARITNHRAERGKPTKPARRKRK